MKNKELSILITGAAGFIGAALSKKFLKEGFNVVGIDNLNNYYDVSLKHLRLKDLQKQFGKDNSFEFFEIDLENYTEIKSVVKKFKINIVIHLAAQAGVRYSLENPESYIQSNLVGFGNILEICRKNDIYNFLFASSSSVYGGNLKLPFSENDSVNHPISLYAATKKSNELMAHSYSHLYDIPTIGLRFFTVYGPFGRPDMAPMIFAKAILEEKPIKVFNFGNMRRDFTYIEDIVEAVFKCALKPPKSNVEFDRLNPDSSSSFAPYRIFNIGNGNPIELGHFIKLLEENLDKKALLIYEELQPGDVVSTLSDVKLLKNWINYKPNVMIEEGVYKFCKWFKTYHKSR